jgi:two-component system KDP operon response regulator KdpE
MPALDGWQTLEQLRGFSQVPVIMLTAMGDEPDVLKGFSLGADDYVPKPFSFAQLAARIEAILRRATTEGSPYILESGELVVDLVSRRVRLGDDLLSLTPTEFKLLVALMEQPGKVLTSRELATGVWGPEYADDTDYVRRYVWHLRRRIEPDSGNPKYIHNERGVGYYFAATS